MIRQRVALLLAAALVATATVGATTTASAATTSASAAGSSVLTESQIRSATPTALYRGGLYRQSQSVAAIAAARLSAQGDTAEAAAASYIAKRPVAIWLGPNFQGAKLTDYVRQNVDAAEAAGMTPVFVTYAIPDRDCGGYSSGGLSDSEYLSWNRSIATTLRGHRAVVLVEPDSLGQTTTGCASIASSRIALVRSAVETLASNGVTTYLDGGNSRWLKPAEMASLLNRAGVQYARGFFTNVSNYIGVDDERAYAGKVSALTGGAHFVIDVSRNGQGYRGSWCNAPGAGLGQDPHVTSGTGRLDALLWVKTPGSSDGTCNGGPAAGQWFASYARSLVALRR
ncbi:glycoside hydrolase family 6 protein [Frondihabitans australicus]|uniref:Glucanase n=1 Tax=Frondihabitans australicus TaxID=386892 RepID=A0A495IK22_9MICO|nr:glycoside hydrolase family 6 protein [Frondihabitans australicus]RKR76070.1 endoglucanase [Frondihabitans australicus]